MAQVELIGNSFEKHIKLEWYACVPPPTTPFLVIFSFAQQETHQLLVLGMEIKLWHTLSPFLRKLIRENRHHCRCASLYSDSCSLFFPKYHYFLLLLSLQKCSVRLRDCGIDPLRPVKKLWIKFACLCVCWSCF